MTQALYAPHLGYYAGGSRKFGPAATSSPRPRSAAVRRLRGRPAALASARVWSPRITEFGAGSGALAATLLVSLGSMGLDGVRYDIVEVSGELAARQRRPGATLPQALERVRWLGEMPVQLSGAVLGNELLDAVPVRLFRLNAGALLERGVTCAGSQGKLRARCACCARLRSVPINPRDPAVRCAGCSTGATARADPAFTAQVAASLRAAGWPSPDRLPGDLEYLSELGEQARAWIATVVGRLRQGVVLLFDYGFPSAEYFHPQRAGHAALPGFPAWADDPGPAAVAPGLQDVHTAHVDFGAGGGARRVPAARSGSGCTSQGAFLLGSGLLGVVALMPGDDPCAEARRAYEVQALVSEAEMGRTGQGLRVLPAAWRSVRWARLCAGRSQPSAVRRRGFETRCCDGCW
jgi:SAM-dependent MidA family methyltransferase